ncbi:MAG: hypothetical protein JO016_18675 [Actinobacteria bacterium]|nr:hypothetical protein [Actinomycetota bacterium]
MDEQGGWQRLVQAVRRRPAVWAGSAAIILVVVIVIAVSAGGGGPAPAAKASAKPEPGAITVDDVGHALNAKVVAVERAVLADARARNRTALDRLLSPDAPASLGAAALDQVLAQSGTYTQIITLLTRTHGASQNGFTIWPGFFLAGTGRPADAADARVLGVASGQPYAGVTLIIGASATGNPYVPKLVSITRNVP